MPTEVAFFGDEIIEVSLPEGTEVLCGPAPLPAAPDVAVAVRQAIEKPVGCPPLAQIARRGTRVVIAFDDLALPVPSMEEPDVRAVAVPIVVDTLLKGGVARDDITLLCANGLHRKCRPAELATVLGEEAVAAFAPDRLLCHDAEAEGDLFLAGETAEGHAVEVNRLVAAADLTVYLNVSWTTMNGGWKSFVVGLGSRRSISHHHAPEVLASEHSKMDPQRSPMHRIIDSMGDTLARALGRERFFSVETVLNNQLPYQVAAVYAGFPPEVHRRTLATLAGQQNIPVHGQADVLVYCLPNLSPYAVGAIVNPVLVYNLALGYVFALYQRRPLVRAGGAIVVGQPCAYQFDDAHHPSYREFFDRVLAATRDPSEMRAHFEPEFLRRPEYRAAYQHGYGFHALHPFYAWYWAGCAAQHAGRIYLAGVREAWVAERLGLAPASSVAEAIADARRYLRGDPMVRYLRLPPLFSGVAQ